MILLRKRHLHPVATPFSPLQRWYVESKCAIVKIQRIDICDYILRLKRQTRMVVIAYKCAAFKETTSMSVNTWSLNRNLKTFVIYSRGGQLAARGPHVARRSVFSGPRKHSEKIFKLKISSNLVLCLTCRPPAKHGIPKVSPEQN